MRLAIPLERHMTTITRLFSAAALVAAGWMLLGAGSGFAAEKAVTLPVPAVDAAAASATAATETAVFAGGGFWGVQGVFQHTRGVLNAVSGYAGGDQASASYNTVSSGRTGHAESVQVTYDPKQVSYGQLLRI